MSDYRDLLRLNVGFIIHQTVGFSRDFPFDIPAIRLSPELELHDLNGVARISRTSQGLLVQVKMRAFTEVECVRCLSKFSQKLNIDFTDLYAFSPDSVTDSGLLLPDTGKIDLEPILREEMFLAMPINTVCSPECKGLCPICGNDLNKSTCSHEEALTDPRLDNLRSLLDKQL
jgi:uncharacterized protein